jgi:hypothetical protein
MGARSLHPDPVDFQLIRCSNMLQIISCCCDTVACCLVFTVGGDIAEIAVYTSYAIDCVACCFASSVGGCMYVQVMDELHEMEKTDVPVAVIEAVVEQTMER